MNKIHKIKTNNTNNVEMYIQTTAECLTNITLYDKHIFNQNQNYNVIFEIKGDILNQCYSEYVYVGEVKVFTEDFLQNFKLIVSNKN